MAASDMQSYPVSGIRVSFPCKPYPSQLSMMAKIIKGIQKKENSLLESPTGSGKSLALLCSVLAWQTAERAKLADQTTGYCTCRQYIGSAVPHISSFSKTNHLKPPVCADRANTVGMGGEHQYSQTVSQVASTQQSVGAMVADLDFKSVPKKFRIPSTSLKRQHKSIRYDDTNDLTQTQVKDGAQNALKVELPSLQPMLNGTNSLHVPSPSILQAIPVRTPSFQVSPALPVKQESVLCNFCVSMREGPAAVGKTKTQSRIPKVYFGTRTHKQIAQIVRELKKTSYHDTRMCVLGSREHACIHPVVSKNRHKNEECQKLLSSSQRAGLGGCHLFQGMRVKSYSDLRAHGFETAWDLEELVGFGQETGMCPYFISRNLLSDADIVFCPYNYLIDPKIRNQMGIDLTEQIVLLDEAHNIEDSSRDAASFSVTLEQLQTASDEVGKMVEANMLPKSHQAMRHICDILIEWIDINKSKVAEHDFETQYKVVTGPEMVAFLSSKGISMPNMPILKDHLASVTSYAVEFRNILSVVSTSSLTVLENISLALQFLLGNGGKYTVDYRVAVGRLLSTKSKEKPEHQSNWRHRRSMKQKTWEYSLFFWCLNPAVAFSEVSCLTRCVIVSSGTLSPLNTFSSELGTNFPIYLEASHVIRQEQVWIGSLGVGPNGLKMDGRFKVSETFEYQDEVGEIVLQVCKIIPFGVLCFVPSYSHLNKFYTRWQRTGLMEQLVKFKCVLTEPRGSEKADFETVLQDFYEFVEKASEKNSRGALLIAVCRGKVSEGLDFADNNARAVITIGIPYPSIKDVQVELKRAYNDQYAAERGLMRGSQWYETQAYRALNQALGRCLRHKRDWGALLMIDERFGQSDKYTRGLSKWIREQVHHFSLCDMALESIKKFSNDRMSETSTDDFNMSTVADTSTVISPIKSAATHQMVTSTVTTPLGDRHLVTNQDMVTSSPAFVSDSKIHSTVKPTDCGSLVAAAANCNHGPVAVSSPIQTVSNIVSVSNGPIAVSKVKSECTPLLFSSPGSEEQTNCDNSRQSSVLTKTVQNKPVNPVCGERDGQPERRDVSAAVPEQQHCDLHSQTNVRMGRKREIVTNRDRNDHKRAHGDDCCLLSVFEDNVKHMNASKQFVYPDVNSKTHNTNEMGDYKTLEGGVKCKNCQQLLVTDCAGTEVGSQTVGFLDWVAKSSSPTDCFVCSVDDLTTNCVLYPHIAEAVTSSPLSELNCIWNEVEGLTYILLTCSNCATQHSDKGVPLVGVRVVGVSHPSLNDRLNQVYLLQSAVD